MARFSPCSWVTEGAEPGAVPTTVALTTWSLARFSAASATSISTTSEASRPELRPMGKPSG